jgi:hypothetical protein
MRLLRDEFQHRHEPDGFVRSFCDRHAFVLPVRDGLLGQPSGSVAAAMCFQPGAQSFMIRGVNWHHGYLVTGRKS